MERMDEILSYWASRTEEFPEGLRSRGETGCCFVTGYQDPTNLSDSGDHTAPPP